ncbi:MAG TPA: hypothetical protein PKA81_11370 [Clostridia bacterium]|nr:hypothetical protein [Clostridia bacterium]
MIRTVKERTSACGGHLLAACLYFGERVFARRGAFFSVSYTDNAAGTPARRLAGRMNFLKDAAA